MSGSDESSPVKVVSTYYDAWRANDFERLRSVLADGIEFSGPFAELEGAEECVRGLERMSEIKTDIVVERMLADGPDVLCWFELHTTLAAPIPVASWGRVENGKLARLRVTFDPRTIAPPT
jgi:limonene-1,2-epoxide hydrolase